MCLGSIYTPSSGPSLNPWSTGTLVAGMPESIQPIGFIEINHRSILPKPSEKAHSLLRSILQEPTSSVSSSPHASPPNPPRSSIGLETIGVDGRHWSYPVEEERLESGLPSHSNTPNAEKDRFYTNTQIVNPVVGYPDSGFIDSLEHLPQLESESPEFQNKFPSGSDSSQRTETTRLERSQAPHTWGYSSDNRESLARSARAIEDTLRLTAMYSDSYEATKMIMPP
ncbi:hypothetical protein F5877DRAFT_79932 [Lentinula edodes]|nr:hypothetical protein F5877DRAFT_79932 [Lentinula edodes]